MKKIISILFIFFFLSQGCKKEDYPQDIPDWVENKIKDIKKEMKCYIMSITEYTDTIGTIIYRIWDSGYDGGDGIGYIEYYNHDGQLICNEWTDAINDNDSICRVFGDKLIYKRFIWKSEIQLCP